MAFTFNEDGTSVQPLTPEQIVKEKLKHLLQTNKGEVVNAPDYGADLIHFVHAPLDSVRENMILIAVKMAVAQYMSYVYLTELSGIRKPRQGVLAFKAHYTLADNFQDFIDIVVNQAA